VVLSVLLGTALKLDGRLTVQTKSDGPLDLAVADYYGEGDGKPRGVRGFARLDEDRARKLGDVPEFGKLAGRGSLAIMIEPRVGGQTYQGIVALSPAGIAASAETYFVQSEQLPTAMRLAAAPLFEAGRSAPQWRAGGIMLQVTPDQKRSDDDWNRLSLILRTVEDLELVDTSLPAETLLWRLFHEDEVRVLPAQPVAFRCECDGGRIASVLGSYSPEERAGLSDPDGVIRARCEFCGTVHEIATESLRRN
jgi:molecular chaperone Hsp33